MNATDADIERRTHKTETRRWFQKKRETAHEVSKAGPIPLGGDSATSQDTENSSLAKFLNPSEAKFSGTGDAVVDKFRRILASVANAGKKPRQR